MTVKWNATWNMQGERLLISAAIYHFSLSFFQTQNEIIKKEKKRKESKSVNN